MKTYTVRLPSFDIIDLMITTAAKGGNHYMVSILDSKTTHLNIISFGPQQNQRASGCFTVIASNETNMLRGDTAVQYYIINFSADTKTGTCMEFDDVEFLSNPFTRISLNIGSKITHCTSDPNKIGYLNLKECIISEFDPQAQKMDTGIFAQILASCYPKWDMAYQHNWKRDVIQHNHTNVECPCGVKWESLKNTSLEIGRFTIDIRALHALICHPGLVPQGELDKILALLRETQSINSSRNWRDIDWKDYRRYVLGTDTYMDVDRFIPKFEGYTLR